MFGVQLWKSNIVSVALAADVPDMEKLVCAHFFGFEHM